MDENPYQPPREESRQLGGKYDFRFWDGLSVLLCILAYPLLAFGATILIGLLTIFERITG